MWHRNSLWVNVGNELLTTVASYKHSGLTAGPNCAYRLRAVNRTADNGLGNWSTVTFANTAE